MGLYLLKLWVPQNYRSFFTCPFQLLGHSDEKVASTESYIDCFLQKQFVVKTEKGL